MLKASICPASIEKLTVTRMGFKAEFEKLSSISTLPDRLQGRDGAPLLPTGPMMTLSNSMGCTGAKLAIGGGAGLMAVGMVMEDGGMFDHGRGRPWHRHRRRRLFLLRLDGV